MEESQFIDYYEILEISPNANSGTIERMFRYLAQRYHPDNPETGDRGRFDAVLEAHHALGDPVERARYDIHRKNQSSVRAQLVEDVNSGLGRDVDVQNKLLSILYVKCRQNIKDPGLSDYELEQLVGCPLEHLEFHVWYLKEKGLIRRADNGMLATTADGVDHANSEQHRVDAQKLLTDRGRDNLDQDLPP